MNGGVVLQATTGRLYPTRKQSVRMAQIGGQIRAIWNHFLAMNKERYGAEGKFTFYHEMSAMIPALRKDDKFSNIPHRCAQFALQGLSKALKDCGKSSDSRKGFPRFKEKEDRRDCFQFAGCEIQIYGNRVKVPILGWVRIRGLRVPVDAKLYRATVRQAPCGTSWEFSLQFEAASPVVAPRPTGPIVGVDVGLLHLAVLSDGTKIGNPRRRIRLLRWQRFLQRQRDRRQKGSVNRRRTVARLARIHRKIKNVRADYLHKATRSLVNEYAGFAVEKLSLKGLARTQMAGSLSDAGLGEFRRQLAYKSAWAGREFRELPTFTRSTGVCPECGEVGPRLPLKIRNWICQGCGAEHDRDVAAAQVILLGAVGRGTPEPGPAMARKRGSAVRGGGSARGRPSHGGPPANVSLLSCVV